MMTDDSPNQLLRCYLTFSKVLSVEFLPHSKDTLLFYYVPDYYSYAITTPTNQDIKCIECINNESCHKVQFLLEVSEIL